VAVDLAQRHHGNESDHGAGKGCERDKAEPDKLDRPAAQKKGQGSAEGRACRHADGKGVGQRISKNPLEYRSCDRKGDPDKHAEANAAQPDVQDDEPPRGVGHRLVPDADRLHDHVGNPPRRDLRLAQQSRQKDGACGGCNEEDKQDREFPSCCLFKTVDFFSVHKNKKILKS
jgi:hypothetical protein